MGNESFGFTVFNIEVKVLSFKPFSSIGTTMNNSFMVRN